jgi:uncharacterized repeat protein (TIGR03803 family)
VGGLLKASDGILYGVTSSGGISNAGTIYHINQDGSSYAVMRSLGLGSPDAAFPYAGLAEGPDGALYGIARNGGYYGSGAIYRIERDGSAYSVVHHFGSGGNDGLLSLSGLILARDGAFYGTTSFGGLTGLGTVFRFGLISNHNPAFNAIIPDLTNRYGSSLSYSFDADTFLDPDLGQTLTYSASVLPPGITLDGPSRTFGGTPTNIGTYTITVTATDNGTPAMSTNTTFQISVLPAPLIVRADNQSLPYGQVNPPLTGTLVGVTNNDNITASFETTATPSSPPGDYAITPVLSDPDNRLGNYQLTINEGTLLVGGVTLRVSLSSGLLTFCWPSNASNFVLEYADNLNPPIAWHAAAGSLSTNGAGVCQAVTPDLSVPARFYHLRLY